MTGTEYANLVASYVARRFASRGLTVYREVRVGKTIIGKDRCIDIFCVSGDASKAFAIECKFQDSQGTTDEKIPYALEDLRALPMTGCIAYAGQGFSDGILHMLRAAPDAAYCMPTPDLLDATGDTKELDQIKTHEPRPPRQLDLSIPVELDRVCLKAMAKRRAYRYSTAFDLAEDLRLAHDHRVEARRHAKDVADGRRAGAPSPRTSGCRRRSRSCPA